MVKNYFDLQKVEEINPQLEEQIFLNRLEVVRENELPIKARSKGMVIDDKCYGHIILPWALEGIDLLRECTDSPKTKRSYAVIGDRVIELPFEQFSMELQKQYFLGVSNSGEVCCKGLKSDNEKLQGMSTDSVTELQYMLKQLKSAISSPTDSVSLRFIKMYLNYCQAIKEARHAHVECILAGQQMRKKIDYKYKNV